MEEIKNLFDLVAEHLEEDEKIVKYETTSLTAPGENYGSLMLSLKITVKNEKNQSDRVLETIAKLLPRNEVTQEMFNVQKTFKNEIAFYAVIIPTLKNFLKQSGFEENIYLDFVAKFFGGRTSLSSKNEKVDNDAIVILENLKLQGFTIGNRLNGFDHSTAKIVLKTLAKFHAIPLALKIKDPATFENKIKPHLTDFMFLDKFEDWLDHQIVQGLQDDPHCSKYLELARTTARKKSDKGIDEKWATILHNDLWVNNIMIKHDDGKDFKVKIVDFQICEYKSCLRDLIFFLFTSVPIEVLEKHLDDLLDTYYEYFVGYLTELGVDPSQYSRREFDDQLKRDGKKSVYYQVQQMSYVICLEGKPIDPSEMTHEILDNFRPTISQRHKDRIVYTTKEFVRRGWL